MLLGLCLFTLLAACVAPPPPSALPLAATVSIQPTATPHLTIAPAATATATPAPTISLNFLTPTAPITSTPPLSPTPTPRPSVWSLPAQTIPEPFGVNIHFTAPVPGEMSRLEAVGVRWVRMDFFWSNIERERGRYDFTAYDGLVTTMERRNIRILFILNYGNDLYGGGPAVLHDEGRRAFARFTSAAAARYRGRGIIWEIWNEPNLEKYWHAPPDPVAYARLVNAVVPAIRSVDPTALIIGPATVGFPWEYFDTLHATGALARLDAVSVHPYRGEAPESALEQYLQLRARLDRLSPHRRMPILASEWGYSTAGGWYTESVQAQYLIRQWLFHLTADVELSIWYDWRNNGTDPADEQHNFGIVTYELAPKTAYRAAQTLAQTLAGYTYQRRLPLDDLNDYVLLFQRDDQLALAAWTMATTTHAITLPLPCPAITLTQVTGNVQTLLPLAEQFTLELDSAPRYVQLCTTEITQRWGYWKPEHNIWPINNETTNRVLIAFDNPFWSPLHGDVRVVLHGQVIGEAPLALPPGEQARVSIPLTLTQPLTTATPAEVYFVTLDALPLQTARIWLNPIQP